MARSIPANMIDIRMDPSRDSQVCTNVSLPVSRHRPRWKLRSASILPSRSMSARAFAHGVEDAAQLLGCFDSISALRQRSCGHGLEGRTYGVDVTDLFGAEVTDVQASPGCARGEQALLLGCRIASRSVPRLIWSRSESSVSTIGSEAATVRW